MPLRPGPKTSTSRSAPRCSRGQACTTTGWVGTSGVSSARRAAQEVARRVPNLFGFVVGGSHAGLGLTGLGRHEEALKVLDETIAEAREIELTPIFTARLINVTAGTHHELYETEEARRLNEEAIELGKRAGFSAAAVSGETDLLFSDLLLGEVGRAEAAWPGLWEAAEASKGWHQWLWMTRLAAAKAEIELAAARAESAADAARRAIDHAVQYQRPKYAAASRLTLGAALLALGRGSEAEAEAEIRCALTEAKELGHPPSIWRAESGLGAALAATGHDEDAHAAYTAARETVERFAAALSPERRARFLAAPKVTEILAATH